MQINRKELLNALKLVGKAVPSRPLINVLEGILFELSTDHLVLSGFDINNGIQIEMPIEPQLFTGTFLISAKVIQSVLAKFNTTEIDIDFLPESVTISNESASAEIQLMTGAEDYPSQCFDIGTAQPQLIDKSIIEGMLSVLFATSGDESKQILTSVNVSTNHGQITFAATDGHRLAVTSIESTVQIEPISLGNSGLKLLSGFSFTDSEIAVYRVDSGLIIIHEGVTFLIREIDGKYPDYLLLMPKQFKIVATADKRELVSAIELASTSDNRTKAIKLSLDRNLTVASAGEIVKSSSVIEVQLHGSPIDFAMNSDYLLDALSQLDLAEVSFNINTPLSPITIEWQENNFSKTILLMPVQLRA